LLKASWRHLPESLGLAINGREECSPAMQRYGIIHSLDGVQVEVLPTLAQDLEAAWGIARQSFPQQHVMVLLAQDEG
jgi:hypothetical protein